MKKFLHQIKYDFDQLFSYPQVNLGEHPVLDYQVYWEFRKKSRPVTSLSSWQKQRADLILPIISEGDTVIDLGGGNGEILNYLKQKKNVDGICVDFHEGMLELAATKGLRTMKADISDIKELERVPECDYLLCLEILEHINNPEQVVKFLEKKVRKGIIVSFPNSGYYIFRLRLLFGRFPAQWFTHPSEHIRFWTVRDAKWWGGSLGFSNCYTKLYEGLSFLNKIFPSLFARGQVLFLLK